MIDDRPLRFRGEVYHPYHFNCSSCGIELNADAREVKSRPGFTANEMVFFFLPLSTSPVPYNHLVFLYNNLERTVLLEMSRQNGYTNLWSMPSPN